MQIIKNKRVFSKNVETNGKLEEVKGRKNKVPEAHGVQERGRTLGVNRRPFKKSKQV